MPDYELTPEHRKWSSRKKQGLRPKQLRELIVKQKGQCALSHVTLIFDKKKGTPVSGGSGCHPCYAAVDHIAPGRVDHGHQIVCYDLNDLKGHLPRPLFIALQRTHEWQHLMAEWKKLAEIDNSNIAAFKTLIKEGQCHNR